MQDQDKTKVAEDKLAQTFGTTMALWQKLKHFYNIASGGLPSGGRAANYYRVRYHEIFGLNGRIGPISL